MERPAPPPPFSAEVVAAGRRATVVLRGELDIATAPIAQQTIDRCDVVEGGQLVIDMRELSFIDSTGIRLMVELDGRARRAGYDVAFVRPGPLPYRALEIAGVTARLLLVDDPAELRPPET